MHRNAQNACRRNTQNIYRWKVAVCLILGCLALAGCAVPGGGLKDGIRPEDAFNRRVVTVTPEARLVKLGEAFDLPFGQTAELDGARLKVTFLTVVADARCPVDVQCVSAGEARFQVKVEQEAGVSPTIMLSTLPDMSVASVGGYKIKLLKVQPEQIEVNQKPGDEAYVLTLVVIGD